MDPNFQRRRRKERIYDKFQRGFANTCMTVTAIATLFLGYKAYEYFRYVRPLDLAQKKLAQEELLQEGRSVEGSPSIELST